MNKSKKEHIKVLHLARWYPHRYDPMPGLFIQRHAEAVARCCKTGVVYTHVAEEKIKGFEMDFSVINNVPTARIYYHNRCRIPILSHVINAFRFFRANFVGIRKIQKELGGFDVIHVHVLTRLGIIALGYKWFKNKPYIISEHWSRYLPMTGDFRGSLRKWFTKVVVRNASAVTTVTRNLAVAMQSHGLKNEYYKVLANVVTDDFLKFQGKAVKSEGKKSFIHVSCFEDRSKNISGLIRVISSLAKKRNDFVFKLVGEGMDFDSMRQLARQAGLTEEEVIFTGLLEGTELVNEMASANMMVVFSHYENFPVVINESFSLGVPVVATRVGGIPEFVNKANGCLLDAGDEKALEQYLIDYLDGKLIFDREKIREQARKEYSPEKIGGQLCAMYKHIK